MKCPECDGVGRIHYGEEWCSACNGTGEVQTNEEWFCQLSTEEKAKFFDSKGMGYCVCGCKECIIAEQCKSGGIRKTHEEMWVEWLKQPHTKE